MILVIKNLVCRRLLTLLASMIVVFLGLGSLCAPSYAASTQVTPAPDSLEVRERAYEEAKDIANDVKMGVEKAYEENVEEFFEEHPEEQPGLIQEAKEIVEDLTGSK